MTPERSIRINGNLIEEFCWNGRLVVYVNNRKVVTTYEETCNLLLQPNQKIVKNLMTKKDVVVEKDTPLCCDPSSETYWSM